MEISGPTLAQGGVPTHAESLFVVLAHDEVDEDTGVSATVLEGGASRLYLYSIPVCTCVCYRGRSCKQRPRLEKHHHHPVLNF